MKMVNRLSQVSIMRLIAALCSIILGCVVIYSIWGAAEEFRNGTTFAGEPYDMADFSILLVENLLKTMISFTLGIMVVLICALVPCIPFICLHASKENAS